jgi:hypothetical protein
LLDVGTILAISLQGSQSSLDIQIDETCLTVCTRQSQLVVLISSIVQYEIKEAARDVTISAGGEDAGRLAIEILSRPRHAADSYEDRQSLAFRAHMALIDDLRALAACEVHSGGASGEMTYSLSLAIC